MLLEDYESSCWNVECSRLGMEEPGARHARQARNGPCLAILSTTGVNVDDAARRRVQMKTRSNVQHVPVVLRLICLLPTYASKSNLNSHVTVVAPECEVAQTKVSPSNASVTLQPKRASRMGTAVNNSRLISDTRLCCM